MTTPNKATGFLRLGDLTIPLGPARVSYGVGETEVSKQCDPGVYETCAPAFVHFMRTTKDDPKP